MKKNIASLIFIAALSLCVTAIVLAAPSNGTRLPPKGGAEWGYEYSAMFKRPLARSFGNSETQDHFYTLSLGIFDWLSLDGKIGMGNVRQYGGTRLPKIEYNTGFAGGYGVRIKLYDNKMAGFKVLIGAQHISVHPDPRSVNDEKYRTFLDDWQACAVISQQIKCVNVYAGLKGSDCESVYKINGHDKKRRYSRYHLGLVNGLELYLLKDKVRAGIEGRFFDEYALSTSVSYLF